MKQDQNKCVKTLEKLGIIYRQKTLLGMGGKSGKKERGVALLRGLDGFPNVSKHQTEVHLITEASLNTAEFNHRLTY